ncbi:MAG: hypothetical protein Kow0049_22580 [Stanieria sp.]|jgi:hypothetical protein
MSKIKLSQLYPAGLILLRDSENFLDELNEDQLDRIIGGNNVISTGMLSFLTNVQSRSSVETINSISQVALTQTIVDD